MRTQNMVTVADYDRLSALVRSPECRRSYGVMAQHLGQGLHHSKVVGPERVPSNLVTMNSTVRICDVGSEEREVYTIVYPEDANIDLNRISVLAPLGAALLGAKAGDVVNVDVPAGLRRVRIEHVVYQPEAAGDYHL